MFIHARGTGLRYPELPPASSPWSPPRRASCRPQSTSYARSVIECRLRVESRFQMPCVQQQVQAWSGLGLRLGLGLNENGWTEEAGWVGRWVSR